jgi:hypothetical protein
MRPWPIPNWLQLVAWGNYYRQRGQSGPQLERETATVLGGFATVESIAYGHAAAGQGAASHGEGRTWAQKIGRSDYENGASY